MKDILIKIAKYSGDFLRRSLFILAEIVMWPIWLISTCVFVFLEMLFFFIGSVICWLFLGSDKTAEIMEFVFQHDNDEIWYREEYGHDSFMSMVPLWAKYVHKHYLEKFLPKEDQEE